MRPTDHDVAFMAREVVNPIRNGFAHSILKEVRREHLQRRLPLSPARVLEEAHQLLFLGIHADNGQSGFLELAALASDVAHLTISFGVLVTTQPLAIRPQGIAFEVQQTGDGRPSDPEFPAQSSRQFAQRLARPLETGNGIAGGGVGQ
jgi:hypothetical protein